MKTPDLDETDLRTLLTKCALKDRAAFTDLYEKTSPAFFQLVKRFVSDQDLAHDILQKGYLSIWRRAHTFNAERGNAFTWMLVIMRNQAIDDWRRETRYRIDSDVPESLADDRRGPARLAEMADARQYLEACLSQLPAQMAFVIRQRFFHEKTVAEIAAEFQLSANSVRSWIRRGLERLKSLLPPELSGLCSGYQMSV